MSDSPGILRIKERLPAGTWDTHMHTIDPRAFPLAEDARYQPQPHTLDDARAFLSQMGVSRMCIVQPSIYGNDNSCTLDGLRRLGPEVGRAVVQFDPETTSKAQLQQWHDLGVRGVRLNFKSVGTKPDAETLERQLRKYSGAIRELEWVLELYIALEDVPLLEPIVPQLSRVKVCIDHFGHPSPASVAAASSAHDLQGFSSLIRLLKQGQTWVKLSASYRLDSMPRHPVIESLCRELVKARSDRCVLATDWPHTRFEGLDVCQYLEAILDWIEAEDVDLEQICVRNAQGLLDAGA